MYALTGNINSVASTKIVKENGKLSSDEIYIHRCEEYSGGVSHVVDETCC